MRLLVCGYEGTQFSLNSMSPANATSHRIDEARSIVKPVSPSLHCITYDPCNHRSLLRYIYVETKESCLVNTSVSFNPSSMLHTRVHREFEHAIMSSCRVEREDTTGKYALNDLY